MARKRNIQADILNYISDGKLHSMQAIADEVEVSYITVRRHIEDLSFHYNIETLKGGIDRGGVRLISSGQVNIENLSCDDLKTIIDQLGLLQNSNQKIKAFASKLSTLKDFKEKKICVTKKAI